MAQRPGPDPSIGIEGEEAPSVPLTADSLAAIIKGAVSEAVGGVKRELENKLSEQKIALESAAQELEKVKTKQPKFRFRGNEEQFKFNCKVHELVDQGLKLINSGSSATAVPIIEKAKEELSKRNKLVKLADKSEAGWAAVDEYEQDELASNSDDDKKLRSAQARASAKKKKGKVMGKSRAKPYQRVQQASYSNYASNSDRFAPHSNFRRFNASYQYNRSQNQQGPRADDLCFGCGKPGHWRRTCPGTPSSSSSSK